MYEVSEDFTKLMDDETSVIEVLVKCVLDNAKVIDGDIIQKIEIVERVNDNSNILTLGNACSHSAILTLLRPPEIPYKGLPCDPWCGIKFPDGTEEWVPLGKYWIDSAKTDDDYRTAKIVAYDKMYKLTGPYTTSLTYPALFADVVAEFENLAGVKVVKPETFPEFYIEKKVEDGKYTLRDIAGHLAGCLGKNATFNRDGDMEFKFYEQTRVKAVEDLQYMRGFEKLSDNPLKINFLIIGQEGEEKIELENDGTDPGALDWRMFDSYNPADFPWLTFTYDADTLTASVRLTEGYEDDTEGIMVPYSLLYNDDTYNVTSVEASGFSGCQANELVLPHTLISIGNNAFSGCAFADIAVPENVSSVGTLAFANCVNLEKVHWNAINVASTADSTAYPMFSGCSLLKDFVIGENVETLPAYMLAGCTGVTNIFIPDSVITIGRQAFYGCSNLTSLTIPANVTTVGNNAFEKCTSLETVYWNATKLDSAPSAAGYVMFSGCSSLKTFVIGNGVEALPAYMVAYCTGLTSVTIPYSVKSIGKNAFYGCTSITEITIPANVTTVGNLAFEKCTSLETVYWNATKLDSAPSFAAYAMFYNCPALKNYIIGSNVTAIPPFAICNIKGVTSILVPDSVTTIGKQAFSGCSGLTSVQIGETADCAISSIATTAFSSDTALTNITIYKSAGSLSGSPWGASNATITWAIEG